MIVWGRAIRSETLLAVLSCNIFMQTLVTSRSDNGCSLLRKQKAVKIQAELEPLCGAQATVFWGAGLQKLNTVHIPPGSPKWVHYQT